MIFMLPYMRSFENGPTGRIQDYDHYKGTLFTNTLRWSYGATNGSENDLWYFSTSQLAPDNLIIELANQGFAGIYINLDGYESEKGNELLERLCLAANCETVIRNSTQTKVFISLRDYREIYNGYSWFLLNYIDENGPLGYEKANQLAGSFLSLNPTTCKDVFDIINSKANNDTEFIQLLYKTLLHRECNEEELNSWIVSMNHDRYAVFMGFIVSNEFREKGL